MTIETLREISSHNLRTFQNHYVSEISGSLGDLGTFLPIAIALAVNGTVSLSSTLIFSGIFFSGMKADCDIFCYGDRTIGLV